MRWRRRNAKSQGTYRSHYTGASGLMTTYPRLIEKSGAPGEIRTPDPLVRSQMLYPAELRAHRGWSNEFTKMESAAQRQVAADNSLACASRCLLNRGVRKQLNDSGHPSRLYNDCQRYDVCTPARGSNGWLSFGDSLGWTQKATKAPQHNDLRGPSAGAHRESSIRRETFSWNRC